MPSPIQLLCGRQSRWATAHNGHSLATTICRWLGHHPPLVKGSVGYGHLDLLDRDGIFIDTQHAGRLAGGGADASGKLREVICGVQSLAGFVPLIAVHQIVEVGNDISKRATGVTKRHSAVHAACALPHQFFGGQNGQKFIEVLESLLRRLFACDRAFILHESAGLTHLKHLLIKA